MPIVSLAETGVVGLNFDIPATELVAPAWTSGQNIRFQDGSVQAIRGDAALISTIDTPSFQPIWAFPFAESVHSTVAWILPSVDAVKAFYNDTLYDITNIGGPYTGALEDRWSGGALGGLFILNNGVDIPQVWTEINVATPLIDLANWPANTKAACIRSFKNFLVALDITKTSTPYRTMVKWSHPADPGLVPPSWDETDTTKDAGEYSLTESAGICVDAVPLKDNLIIYKEDSVWGMQYIGGTFVFRFYKIFGNFGMPQRDCAVEYQSGLHIVFTGDDLILHDGNTAQSIATNKVRSLLRQISVEQLRSCYMVAHVAQNEVWFCFRQQTDDEVYADTALIYNWVDKTFGIRTLADYYCIAAGRISPDPLLWQEAIFAWQSKQTAWDELSRESSIPRLFAVGPDYVYWADVTQYVADQIRIERTHIGVPVKAKSPPDLSTYKFIRRLWPRFRGNTGQVVLVQIGTLDEPNASIQWQPPQQFVIGVTQKLDVTLSAKMFALRLSSQAGTNWIFSGMDVDMVAGGEN